MKEAANLLALYEQLWNNRTLNFGETEEQDLLEKAIKIELRDELTHPRTRKNPLEKYFLAIKRITASSLKPAEKLLLIKLFSNMLDEIQSSN